jgi:hypothetical protein
MLRKKAMKRSGKSILARVQKEVAKSSVAKSARKKYANLGSPVRLTKARKPPGREPAESYFVDEL